jgi:hypothetical protein
MKAASTRAMQMREEFKALVKKYNDQDDVGIQDVMIRAVTGILVSTAKASSNSPGGACEVIKAVAAEATEAVKEVYKIESYLDGGQDIFFDADSNVVAADNPRAVTVFFAETGHFEDVGDTPA